MLAGYFGYQNFYILPYKHILFIEANKDENSLVYELPKLKADVSNSLVKVWKLKLEHTINIFPLNWLLILNDKEFWTGTKFGELKYYNYW